VLLASGRGYREVAEALEISVGSVHNIMKEPDEDLEPFIKQIKVRFAKRHFILEEHILARISDSNIVKASLKDKVLSATILEDKALLIDKELEFERVENEALPPTPEPIELKPEIPVPEIPE
jgi:hypothetical protein